jgi:proteic killer suppression protein
LKRLYEAGDSRVINAQHRGKLENILARLDAAEEPDDMDLFSFRLHPLKGGRTGTWAVTVRANWRVTFRFEGSDATDVDYEDYH